MSMILEALRRSEAEPKDTELLQSTVLGDDPQRPATTAESRLLRRALQMLALLIMLAAATTIGRWMGEREVLDRQTATHLADGHQPPPAASEFPAHTDDGSVAKASASSDAGLTGQKDVDLVGGLVEQMAAASVVAQSQPGAVARDTDPAVLALYAVSETSAAQIVDDANQSVAAALEPAVRERARLDSDPREASREEALAERIATVRSALQEPAFISHPAPFLETLSQQQKDSIPSLFYSAHRSGEDAIAEVVINGDRLRVGERSDDVEVIEILPDSAVLRCRGVVFRLRALNSWVNL